MGILLALLLGASSPCADGKCPATPPAVCANGECGSSKCDTGCKNCPCSGKKVVAAAKSARKSVRSRCRIFRRRK